MKQLVTKPELDAQVALLLGKKKSEVTAVTAAFLWEVRRTLQQMKGVRLHRLGDLQPFIKDGVTMLCGGDRKRRPVRRRKFYIRFRKVYGLRPKED